MYAPILSVARALVPERRRASLRQRVRRWSRPAWLGTLRRTRPLSERWGFDRGTPIDRYYIEQFLAEHRRDIRGRVLEVQNSGYTDRFGVGVERSDVLDINRSNPRATLIADLAAADEVPSHRFDCFVMTQTLQLIYDVRAALTHTRRMLRPGGVLLATMPSITRIDREFKGLEFWRFTPASCARLFEECFEPDRLTLRVYGNVLVATAFLNGMAAEELRKRELAIRDDFFPVIIAVRAVKT